MSHGRHEVEPETRNVIKVYELRTTLGVGSFGKVKLARHMLAKLFVAIKMLNRLRIRNLGILEKVRREIKILKMLNHPHIIRLYEVIETPSDVFLVMEYVPGGELFDYIVQSGKLPENEARRFCQQIICGLECCHANNIIHRDLKPENLLLDKDNNIKIADFGLSNIVRDGELLSTSCGSPNYAAPEVISGNLYAGAEVDLWSCGVILFALLCGSLPFDDNSIPKLFAKIKAGQYNNIPSHVGIGVREMIKGLLKVDPLKRMTIKQIRQNRWFLTNLPEYLKGDQTSFGQAKDVVHMDIFSEVKKRMQLAKTLGPSLRIDVSPDMADDKVMLKITDPKRNDVAVLYDLLLDQRQSKLVLAEQREAAATEKYAGHDYLPAFDLAAIERGRKQQSATQQVEPKQKIRLRKRRWYLGIQSKREAAQVMLQIFKVLSILNFEWRVVSPFNIRCRWRKTTPTQKHSKPESAPPSPGGGRIPTDAASAGASAEAATPREDGSGSSPDIPSQGAAESKGPANSHTGAPAPLTTPQKATTEIVVKISLQLYKVQDQIYLLDFHSLEGHPFRFMSLCSKIICNLQMGLSSGGNQETPARSPIQYSQSAPGRT